MRLCLSLPLCAAALLLAGCGTSPVVSTRSNPSAAASQGTLLLAAELPADVLAAPPLGLVLSHPGRVDEAADPCLAWNELARDFAAAAKLPPTLFARAYALEAVAVHDAIEFGNRSAQRAPAGCLAGAAAAEVLKDLYPAAASQIAAKLEAEGVAAEAQGLGKGEIQRALALGAACGRAAVRRAQQDGSDREFAGTAPSGDGIWTGTHPVTPMCGAWRTWITTSGAEFQPEPPYAFGSAADLADLAEVERVASQRTPEQVAIVHKWADRSPPAIWNALLAQEIRQRGLPARETARIQAYLNMAMHDAFVSCWRTKFEYWTARPFQRSATLTTAIPTPNFPGYTSGHSTISAAAAEVLAEAFPDRASAFRAEAEEAAISRLWGGIHFRRDNEQGLVVGAKIGAKAAQRLRAESARAIAPVRVAAN